MAEHVPMVGRSVAFVDLQRGLLKEALVWYDVKDSPADLQFGGIVYVKELSVNTVVRRSLNFFSGNEMNSKTFFFPKKTSLTFL